MEIWSYKSSRRDESKISIYMSDVSDVSDALRRLAFLHDMCQATCQTCQPTCHACEAHVMRKKRLIHEIYNTCVPMCPHMSQALRRLTFLRDMCLKPHVPHVPHVPRCIRDKCATHEKRKACATHARRAKSLEPLSFFRVARVYGNVRHVRHVRYTRGACDICIYMCLMCLMCLKP